MNYPLPWLRYVDADNITIPDLDLDGLKVRNDAMEKLGTVDGFVVDRDSMRPYYVVVDSGGWFKSKEFLVPIGLVRIDDDRDALVVDIPRERIERFPGFDLDRFERLTQDEIRRMNDAICSATTGTAVAYAASDPMSAAWARPQYRQPDWWTASADEIRQATTPATSGMTERSGGTVSRTLGELQAERELEHGRETARDRELVTAREAEDSPHFDGRAQPGDVLGVETGGERTHIGETTDEENKRRIDAQRAAAKRRK